MQWGSQAEPWTKRSKAPELAWSVPERVGSPDASQTVTRSEPGESDIFRPSTRRSGAPSGCQEWSFRFGQLFDEGLDTQQQTSACQDKSAAEAHRRWAPKQQQHPLSPGFQHLAALSSNIIRPRVSCTCVAILATYFVFVHALRTIDLRLDSACIVTLDY